MPKVAQQRQNTNIHTHHTHTYTHIAECLCFVCDTKLSRSSMLGEWKKKNEEERKKRTKEKEKSGFCFVLMSWLQRIWVIWTLRHCSCVTCYVFVSYVLSPVRYFIAMTQLYFSLDGIGSYNRVRVVTRTDARHYAVARLHWYLGEGSKLDHLIKDIIWKSVKSFRRCHWIFNMGLECYAPCYSVTPLQNVQGATLQHALKWVDEWEPVIELSYRHTVTRRL